MIDPATGGPHGAHHESSSVRRRPNGDRPLRGGGALCDVGPTILSMLGIESPSEMTGTDLRVVA
jgi:2,3-bisphosphoglycerate-independent phosphoglycerate mutase